MRWAVPSHPSDDPPGVVTGASTSYHDEIFLDEPAAGFDIVKRVEVASGWIPSVS